MGAATTVVRWGGTKIARRFSRSLPWIGGAIAVLTVAGAIRRKGWIGGAVDTSLNAIPVVGAIKAAVETARGCDLIPNKPQKIKTN